MKQRMHLSSNGQDARSRTGFNQLFHILQPGFTLIELLAVIAIIGLLAALVIPITSRAMEKGRSVSCMQNIRSLGIAMTLHAADHEGLMPMAGILHPENSPELLDYMGEKALNATAWICPSDRMIKARAALISVNNTNYYYSYGFVEAYLPRCATIDTCSPIFTSNFNYSIRVNDVTHPAVSVFLTDAGRYNVVNNSISFKHQCVQFRHGRPTSMDGMETDQGNANWSQRGYDTKGDFKRATANAFFYDGRGQAMTYAMHCKQLNSFLAAGYSDRSGLLPIPTSEFE